MSTVRVKCTEPRAEIRNNAREVPCGHVSGSIGKNYLFSNVSGNIVLREPRKIWFSNWYRRSLTRRFDSILCSSENRNILVDETGWATLQALQRRGLELHFFLRAAFKRFSRTNRSPARFSYESTGLTYVLEDRITRRVISNVKIYSNVQTSWVKCRDKISNTSCSFFEHLPPCIFLHAGRPKRIDL